MLEQSTSSACGGQPQVEYRNIYGLPQYRVGVDGSVWSRNQRGKMSHLLGEWWRMSPFRAGPGYLGVRLHWGGACHDRYVHRLVLQEFVGPCPDGMECRHLDGDPQNNRLGNLAWGTHQENMDDKKRHGTHGTQPRGESHYASTLSESDVLEIFSRPKIKGVCQSLAQEFGVSRHTVRGIRNGRVWSHLTGANHAGLCES